MRHLARLPTVSVVIPCYNEHFKTLLRTVYSIINRAPRKLLTEIFIVDDGSESEQLKGPLDEYVKTHWPDIVKVIHLPERKGLINARLVGARRASGEVLLFFESHIECGYNWLPPLIEPIAINRKVATCPIIDNISYDTFEYETGFQNGARGLFNWYMSYKHNPLLLGDGVDETQPYQNPVMMGGLVAIERQFFWELGGYDDALDIWGAEQFELSFKIWMCGGMLLDVPCSRIAHVFRGPWRTSEKRTRVYDFVIKNQKRVAEVWMDEYKQYVYDREPEKYYNMDPGDLTVPLAVRRRLNCKPFKWFMETVAPDLAKTYPPMLLPAYASGAVQSVAYPKYCLDAIPRNRKHPVGLYYCSEEKVLPPTNQRWSLSAHRDLRIEREDLCLGVDDSSSKVKLGFWQCQLVLSKKFWSYDRKNQWLLYGNPPKACMEAVRRNERVWIKLNTCDDSLQMKWEFGFINDTALDKFWDGVDDEHL